MKNCLTWLPCVAVSHDTTRIIAGDYLGKITLWNLADGKRLGEMSVNPPRIDERIAAITTQMQSAEVPYKKALEETRALQATADGLAAELTKQQGALKQVEQAVQQAVNEMNTAKQTADAAAKTKAGLEAEKATIDSTLQKASEVQSAITAAKSSADQTLKNLETLKPNLPESEIGLVEDALNVARVHAQDFAERLQRAQQRVKELNGRAAGLKNQIVAAQQKITETQSQVAAAEKRKAENEGKIAAAKSVIDAQQAKVNTARQQVDAARKKAEASKPDIEGMQRQLAKWKAEKFNLKVHESRQAMRARQAEYEQTMLAAKAAQAALDAEQKKLEALKGEYQKLRSGSQPPVPAPVPAKPTSPAPTPAK